VPFGRDTGEPTGAFLAGDRLIWRFDGEEREVCRRADLLLPGDHVVTNALAALAAACLRGARIEHARDGLRHAQPVPHRLEHVATVSGVDFVNDSAATAPAAVLAALASFRDRSVVLIAGGAAKGVDLQPLAHQIAPRVRAVVLLAGTATSAFHEALRSSDVTVFGPYRSMEEAVRCAASVALPGGLVLLSPGCASFGLFRDEFHRGEAFREAVHRLGASAGVRDEP
jgi:UDP-N-acetylmuramoylalanine--D-glutamate ligase